MMLHNNGYSISSAFTKASRPIEHHKWQEVMMHIYCKSFVNAVLEH
jgi:hypothetical protein